MDNKQLEPVKLEKLKSDQNGIEIKKNSNSPNLQLELKSDQNGIEIGTCRYHCTLCLQLKSDQNGIEICISSRISSCDRAVLKSDQNGIEI